MVQTQVQLVVGEELLRVRRRLARGVLVRLRVVQLQAGEDRIVVTDIETFRRQDDGLGFVCFEGRGYGDVVLGIAIQHVHEILLLKRAYG